MTDKTDLIREIHEYVTAHGGENTATHLLVQAASAIQTQAAELEAVGAGGVQALSAAPAPAGWKLVPAEITGKMSDAWQSAFNKQLYKRVNSRGRLKSAAGFKKSCEEVAYVAMLAASPTPTAEQPIGEVVVTKTEDGQIVAVTRQDDEGRILSVIATSDSEGQRAEESRVKLLAECRDAFPIPEPSSPLEVQWAAAMARPEEVPEYVRLCVAAMQATPKVAPVLPEGWTACTIEFGNDGPEEVAYGPQRMMTRLAKWLGKYFARVIADATPKAAPGEPGWWRKRADEIEAQVALTGSPEAMRCYTDMRTLLQAVADAAPQQEAQEPALFVSPKQLAALTDPDDPEGEHGRYLPARKTSKGLFTQPLYTAPQPAPAPLSDDAKDAARYRWLIDQHWIQTEVDWRLISTDQDSTIKQLDAAIDAALAAQGGK